MWQSSVCDVRCFVQGFVVFILVELVVLLVHRLFQHLKELVTLVQVCHDDALTFWDIAIMTNEFAVFAHAVDLMQRQLIWVEVARTKWSTMPVYFVEAFLNCRELVRYGHQFLRYRLARREQLIDEAITSSQKVEQNILPRRTVSVSIDELAVNSHLVDLLETERVIV